MMCIQETKLQKLQKSDCYNLQGDNNIEWVNLEVNGNSGGILTRWLKVSFRCECQVVGKGFIGVFGKYSRNTNCSCPCGYG